VDLLPVMSAGLQSLGKHAIVIGDNGVDGNVTMPSVWVLSVSNIDRLEALRGAGVLLLRQKPDFRMWTDDYSNVFSILKY
jgi:hypothetical protein